MPTWEKNIYNISETLGKYPQESYAAVVHAVKLEWIFLQLFTRIKGDVFTGVEKLLWETFLRAFYLENRNISHPSWEL